MALITSHYGRAYMSRPFVLMDIH